MTDSDHRKQIKTTVLSEEYLHDWQLQISHKEDGIATVHTLTFEQAAMLQHALDDILEHVDEDFQLKETVLDESADGDGRGFE